jgi:hypothetical protein
MVVNPIQHFQGLQMIVCTPAWGNTIYGVQGNIEAIFSTAELLGMPVPAPMMATSYLLLSIKTP